jgi:uncharacterized protein (TIGR03435 family)
MTRVALALSSVIVLPAIAVGQTSAPALQIERPRFDVASVKPNVSREPGIMVRPTPGRVFYANAPVSLFVEQAYGVRPDRIVNYPNWVEKETFDLAATYDPELRQHVPQMLQLLLEERFALRVHRETREMPVYELVKARPDGQLGPGLRLSTADCAPGPEGRSPCTLTIRPGYIRGIGTPWSGSRGSMLTTNIGVWDRPIVDRTGLSGSFDITLEWKADPAQARSDAAARRVAAEDLSGERTSIFTALQEQLGLRLQPASAAIEVLLIDRIERPPPD